MLDQLIGFCALLEKPNAAEPPAHRVESATCQSEAVEDSTRRAGRQPKKKWTTDFTNIHRLFFM